MKAKAIFFITALFAVIPSSFAEVDLSKCSSYYDGCNTCSVEMGVIKVCTLRYCIRQDTPKCVGFIGPLTLSEVKTNIQNYIQDLNIYKSGSGFHIEEIDTNQLSGNGNRDISYEFRIWKDENTIEPVDITVRVRNYSIDTYEISTNQVGLSNSATMLCQNIGGVLQTVSGPTSYLICNHNGYKINVGTLYNSYNELNGNIMYTGGSKYFDETIGKYNYDLVRSDLEGYKFMYQNFQNLTNTQVQTLNNRINQLQSLLGGELTRSHRIYTYNFAQSLINYAKNRYATNSLRDSYLMMQIGKVEKGVKKINESYMMNKPMLVKYVISVLNYLEFELKTGISTQ